MTLYNFVSSSSDQIVPWSFCSGILDQLNDFNGLLGWGTFLTISTYRKQGHDDGRRYISRYVSHEFFYFFKVKRKRVVRAPSSEVELPASDTAEEAAPRAAEAAEVAWVWLRPFRVPRRLRSLRWPSRRPANFPTPPVVPIVSSRTFRC